MTVAVAADLVRELNFDAFWVKVDAFDLAVDAYDAAA